MALTVEVVSHMLACRYASYTVQYIVQCRTIKNLVLEVPITANRKGYHRVILRGNRLSAHLRQDKSFEEIGILGAGGFGKVELVRSRDNSKYYALKTVVANQQTMTTRLHVLAMIERDCAVALHSEHFVKLKAAWLEEHPETGDCFKFLWENMIFGDLDRLIEQLHPMTTMELRFKPVHHNKAFFGFHNGTFRSMTRDVDFENVYRVRVDALQCLYTETQIIKDGGKQREFTQIIYLYIMQLMEGVRFLHEHNITHRDLKPGNVLISQNLTLRIADLGLATHFEALHIPVLHHWSWKKWVTDRSAEQRILFGGAKAQAQFYKHYLSQLGMMRPIGTRTWMAPELDEKFYSVPQHADLRFNPMSYRLSDYFSLGIIAFQLLTGLHPVRYAYYIYGPLTFQNYPSKDLTERQYMIKLSPRVYNPLLYRRLSVEPEDFVQLFIDMRLHELCVKLMAPDPRERLDYARMLQHPAFKSLSEERFAYEPNCFTWNRFVRDRQQVQFRQVLENFRQQGPPAETTTLQRGRAVPKLPAFPLVTFSPGMIASPSDAKRSPPGKRQESPQGAAAAI